MHARPGRNEITRSQNSPLHYTLALFHVEHQEHPMPTDIPIRDDSPIRDLVLDFLYDVSVIFVAVGLLRVFGVI